MNGKNYLAYTFLELFILTIIKLGFFNYHFFSNYGIQRIVFWLLCMAVGLAIIRRLGIINYVEAIFTIIFWTLTGMLCDLLVTAHFSGLKIFSSVDYWTAFVLIAAVAFTFHKKRHVHVRHELHAKEHAAAHHKH